MRRSAIRILSAALVLMICLSGCSYKNANTKLTNTTKPRVGGISGNMMNNGLADGDGDVIVYSWENQLIEVNADGTNRRVLADDWSSHICISDVWIYYRKIGDTSDPVNGIYKIKKDGSEKTQITSDTTQSIYVVGNWLYYNNWSYTTDICRIKTDGTDRETLYTGQYDCLATDGRNLYFDDFGKNIYIKAPMDGGDFDVLISSARWEILSNGWIYYMDGRDNNHYRIKIDGTRRELYENVSSIDYFFATHDPNFSGQKKADNHIGETSKFFTKDAAGGWIAGNSIVYLENKYDPNNTDPSQSPISQTLFARNILNGKLTLLEHEEY